MRASAAPVFTRVSIVARITAAPPFSEGFFPINLVNGFFFAKNLQMRFEIVLAAESARAPCALIVDLFGG